MQKGRYFSKSNSVKNTSSKSVVRVNRRPTDDDGWFETDGMDHLAREIFETIVPEAYDTGLVDIKGEPIIREILKNGIGFRAEIYE